MFPKTETLISSECQTHPPSFPSLSPLQEEPKNSKNGAKHQIWLEQNKETKTTGVPGMWHNLNPSRKPQMQYCLHHLIAIIAAIKNAKSDMILWIVDIQQNVLRQSKNARFPKVDTEDKYADCIICIPFNLSLSRPN